MLRRLPRSQSSWIGLGCASMSSPHLVTALLQLHGPQTFINPNVYTIRSASTVAISIQGLHYIGTGLAAIALAGVGLGTGIIFGNLLVACARQPNMAKALFNYAILGFALTEAIGLFALMLAFLMLFS